MFGESTENGTKEMKNVLERYASFPGQSINFDKSTIFFNANNSTQMREAVLQVLQVRCLDNPEKYLSLPNIVGKNKRRSFQGLKDCMLERVQNWFTRTLSQGGKEVFIKIVLRSISTYAMSCFLFPSSLCKEMEQVMGNY